MRGYELSLIAHPEASEDALEALLKKLGDLIAHLKGTVIRTEKWGKKKLQYPIKKHHKGYYYILGYMGNNQILSEIERMLRFNDLVLRFQTLRIDDLSSLKPAEDAQRSLETPQETPHHGQETEVSQADEATHPTTL